MHKHFVFIWFCHLLADWQLIRRTELAAVPFVFAAADHGRIIITSVSQLPREAGIGQAMRAADAKVICAGPEIYK